MHCIQIVTVYDTNNCGSFLQAWALYKVIKNRGVTVSFVRSPIKRRMIKCIKAKASLIKPILRRKSTTFRMRKSIQQSFSNLKNSLPISTLHANSTIIIGSDTLWNFDDKHFRSNSKYYLGRAFHEHKVYTYAVSAGNTSYDVFSAVPQIRTLLDSIQMITVRDSATQLLVNNTIKRESVIVCDPTLLLQPNDYEEIAVSPAMKSPYILLYYFGSMDEELRIWIEKKARMDNLKIVSLDVNEPRTWSISVPANPLDFLGYFMNASKIVTNTFHGTVFSILFNKEFLVYTINKVKITDFLTQLGITERACNSVEQADDLFSKTIDYTSVQEKLNLLKERSIIQLRQMIEC